MDVIEKKYPSAIITPYIEILKWGNNPLQLLGTGGNRSQLYPSDIDLFSKINDDVEPEEAYDTCLEKLYEASKRSDMFFIEGKVQEKDGEKYKFHTLEELEENGAEFFRYFTDDVDYVKFDFVLLINGAFIELSAIYVFNKDPLDYDKLKLSLSNDMIDLIKEKKYYKSLKRLFAIMKLEEIIPKNKLVEISKLFNSEVGKLYKKNSILKAIELFNESYKDKQSQRIALSVYRNMGFKDMKDMPKIIKDYDNIINREGHKFLEKHYPELLRIKNLKGKPIHIEGFGRFHQSAVIHHDIVHKHIGRHRLETPLTLMGGGFWSSLWDGIKSIAPVVAPFLL